MEFEVALFASLFITGISTCIVGLLADNKGILYGGLALIYSSAMVLIWGSC